MIIDTRTKVLFFLTILLAALLFIFRDPLFCRQIYQQWPSGRQEVIGSTCDQDRQVDPKPSPTESEFKFDPEDLMEA